MIIDKKTVEKLAHLSRLEFNEDEQEKMAKDLTVIVDWMQKLEEIDTEGIEPLTHMSEEVNVVREDVAQDTLSHEDALKNAPKKDSNYFRVPKVMDT